MTSRCGPRRVFEAGRVDVVFSGHVHNYQRTFPLGFTPEVWPDGRPLHDEDRIPANGNSTGFDGRTQTHPQGVIYVITGAAATLSMTPTSKTIPGRGSRSPISSSRKSIRSRSPTSMGRP